MDLYSHRHLGSHRYYSATPGHLLACFISWYSLRLIPRAAAPSVSSPMILKCAFLSLFKAQVDCRRISLCEREPATLASQHSSIRFRVFLVTPPGYVPGFPKVCIEKIQQGRFQRVPVETPLESHSFRRGDIGSHSGSERWRPSADQFCPWAHCGIDSIRRTHNIRNKELSEMRTSVTYIPLQSP